MRLRGCSRPNLQKPRDVTHTTRPMSADEWRSKVLKDLQYALKIAYIGMSSSSAKEEDAALAERCKGAAAALSMARRVMMLGSWLEGISDLASSGESASALVTSWKGVTTIVKVFSDVADDVRGGGGVSAGDAPCRCVVAALGRV